MGSRNSPNKVFIRVNRLNEKYPDCSYHPIFAAAPDLICRPKVDSYFC